MNSSQNVQIPLSLFKKITDFFLFLSLSDRNSFPALYKFDEIVSELNEKQRKINLRILYTNTVYAKDDGQRNTALNNYLKLKNRRQLIICVKAPLYTNMDVHIHVASAGSPVWRRCLRAVFVFIESLRMTIIVNTILFVSSQGIYCFGILFMLVIVIATQKRREVDGLA